MAIAVASATAAPAFLTMPSSSGRELKYSGCASAKCRINSPARALASFSNLLPVSPPLLGMPVVCCWCACVSSCASVRNTSTICRPCRLKVSSLSSGTYCPKLPFCSAHSGRRLSLILGMRWIPNSCFTYCAKLFKMSVSLAESCSKNILVLGLTPSGVTETSCMLSPPPPPSPLSLKENPGLQNP